MRCKSSASDVLRFRKGVSRRTHRNYLILVHDDEVHRKPVLLQMKGLEVAVRQVEESVQCIWPVVIGERCDGIGKTKLHAHSVVVEVCAFDQVKAVETSSIGVEVLEGFVCFELFFFHVGVICFILYSSIYF